MPRPDLFQNAALRRSPPPAEALRPKFPDADPKKAADLAQSFSKWDKNTTAYFTEVQNKIKSFAANGLGIFANGYWGHPAYVLPPEVNLIAVAHYLDALTWQKEIVKIHAVFGGKNPHPNYLVGGVPCSIDVDARLGKPMMSPAA